MQKGPTGAKRKKSAPLMIKVTRLKQSRIERGMSFLFCLDTKERKSQGWPNAYVEIQWVSFHYLTQTRKRHSRVFQTRCLSSNMSSAYASSTRISTNAFGGLFSSLQLDSVSDLRITCNTLLLLNLLVLCTWVFVILKLRFRDKSGMTRKRRSSPWTCLRVFTLWLLFPFKHG